MLPRKKRNGRVYDTKIMKSSKLWRLQNPDSKFSLSLQVGLSSRSLSPSHSHSLSLLTCIPRQVRAMAASTCIPAYPVDLIPPLYYFVRSLGSLDILSNVVFRTLVGAKASFRDRIMSHNVPDIAPAIRDQVFRDFRNVKKNRHDTKFRFTFNCSRVEKNKIAPMWKINN